MAQDPDGAALRAELAALRAAQAALAAELAALRIENAELRPLRALLPLREPLALAAAEQVARHNLRHNFISCLVILAQNGYGREVDPFAGLCRETWREEALFDALKDLPHGALRHAGESEHSDAVLQPAR